LSLDRLPHARFACAGYPAFAGAFALFFLPSSHRLLGVIDLAQTNVKNFPARTEQADQTDQFEIQVTFKGDALKNNEIDVGMFAHSLISFSKLIKKSTSIAFEGGATADLKLKDIAHGSVSVQMILTIAGVAGGALFYFATSDLEQQKRQLLKNLGFIKSEALSLISFCKARKGRKVIESSQDKGNVALLCDDKSVLLVPVELYRLAWNSEIQKHQYGALMPLSGEGISQIAYSSKVNGVWLQSSEIQKNELSYFKPDSIDESPLVEEFSVTGRLDRPSLSGDPSHWKLITREKTYDFKIDDDVFLSKVKNYEIPFVGSDLFRVQMISKVSANESRWPQYEAKKIERLPDRQKHLF
jgi:hypothetical protein